MSVQISRFGITPDGKMVDLYTLTNAEGLKVKMMNYGAIVVSAETPDREGDPANINLGFDSLAGYLKRHPYFGATVGRCCNRIAKGKFAVEGKEYSLATNDAPNHLHGGDVGFDKVIWAAESSEKEDHVAVKFTYRSADGEEGYPGNLDVTATYRLTNDNELVVEFCADSDKPTPVNLTNHCYWNLAGAGSGTVYDHELTVAAKAFLAVDESLIPTGELTDVEDTPLDFQHAQPMGSRLKQIAAEPPGYDHCFALDNQDGELAMAARVYEPTSGRVMEVLTTQPGLQFYTGNFLDGSDNCSGFQQHTAFCLETQHYPDSPNQASFPSTILRPGETYKQTTVHRFSVA